MALFKPFQLGSLALQSRIVMAPMTRNRATADTHAPTPDVAVYYGQRAKGTGLLIAEGTSITPNGTGYARMPGAWSDEQLKGWKAVADAVHAQGGKLFVQIMETGRIGHAENLPAGAEVVAPSAIAAAGQIFTDAKGLQDHPVPREMTTEEVEKLIETYGTVSKKLVEEAGVDGIELHGANGIYDHSPAGLHWSSITSIYLTLLSIPFLLPGYLVEQFLRPTTNKRTDAYGQNRNLFALRAASAISSAIGVDRTGIRLSPYGVFNDMPYDSAYDAQYLELAKELNGKVGYVHIVDHAAMGAPAVPAEIKEKIREVYKGALILSGGYDAATAEADLAAEKCELIAFGRCVVERSETLFDPTNHLLFVLIPATLPLLLVPLHSPFIANPDLPRRLAESLELSPPDFSTFYTPGSKGYTDYPALA